MIVNSGTGEDALSIVTMGADAFGVAGIAVGDPQSTGDADPFLGVPLVGENPAVAGGRVEINSYSEITTDGYKANGIHAYSASGGYPDSVINALESFDENDFSFEVTEVRDSGDTAIDFNEQGDAQVRGYLIDEEGNPVTDDDENVIEHGTFLIGTDGTYSLSFSEGEIDQLLEEHESCAIAANYTIEGQGEGDSRTDDGRLIVVLYHNNEDGSLEEIRVAEFDSFGLSTKPADDNNPTVFPDLQGYVDGLLAHATSGGAGGTITVNSDGNIETRGEESHGIHAYSIGGEGAPGADSTFYLFWESAPTEGGDGESPGDINISADGRIVTGQDKSSGISAISAGGEGGPGGDGVAYRDGSRGGTGGDGGEVAVSGSADIETRGDYASGIVALSGGGNGGAGGSTGGAMSGGMGGYGGRGGIVDVNGSWHVTTEGDKAHGIWAKSLGGNAGDGGSGGWLWGDPGAGGQATDGGRVTLHSSGDIETSGLTAYGLYAQSVGGFGGSGGSNWGLFCSFGGDGNSGGSGGDVEVINLAGGSVITSGDHSHAILAQSIGGGGGSGGGEFGLFASLGGEGAAGGFGGDVSVENDGLLETSGTRAYGIFAQSVGGGGGSGGDARSMILSIDPSNWVPAEGPPDPTSFSVGATMSLGGSGGAASHGGTVFVENQGGIMTRGADAFGILAQSVGGGGGVGGSGYHGLDLEDFGVPEEYAQYQDLLPVQDDSDLDITLGGTGGGGGDGDDVDVTNNGDINTFGDGALAILAQSIGGGGGLAGVGATGGDGSVGLGGNGGLGGDGGSVAVDL
ncbi:MAG: hypothetical protein KGY42_09220, partial [Desulfobacterales bacterium]|nr:hypothetical protein [Desulfobacterales bacterium]